MGFLGEVDAEVDAEVDPEVDAEVDAEVERPAPEVDVSLRKRRSLPELSAPPGGAEEDGDDGAAAFDLHDGDFTTVARKS
eukprot:8778831-Pyramimonas_sp.AAC.1